MNIYNSFNLFDATYGFEESEWTNLKECVKTKTDCGEEKLKNIVDQLLKFDNCSSDIVDIFNLKDRTNEAITEMNKDEKFEKLDTIMEKIEKNIKIIPESV